MPQLLSTQTVRPQERLSYWVDSVCDTYVHIECAATSRDRVWSGFINVQDLDAVRLTVARSHAQIVRRTRQKICRYGGDYFLLQMPANCACVVEQAGRRALLHPGDFAIYDCAETFTLELHQDFELRFLRIPRHLLQAQFSHINQLTARTVATSSGAGPLIRAIFDQIYMQGTPIAREPRASLSLADALIDIVTAGLSTLSSSRSDGPRNLASYHLARAQCFVRANLSDPGLSPSKVANALNLSPTHLQRIFKLQGQSPMQYVWRSRLERCRVELVNPRHAHRSVSHIAYSAGFSDMAHFSRTFRRVFGISPSEWRRSGIRQALPPVPLDQLDPEDPLNP